MKRKQILLAIVIFSAVSFLMGWLTREFINIPKSTETKTEKSQGIKETRLKRYSIESLSKTDFAEGIFSINEKIKEKERFTSYIFSFKFDANLDDSLDKTTTGIINIPNDVKKSPLVLMVRGYVDQKIYKPGIGSKRDADYLAENGFITIAPDFLGYAGSDKEAENIFEARFQTYVTALSLIKSLNKIEEWDKKHIFIWGHSNGGQIALTILEINGEKFPTVLWAPVSKPFPYSILYYTDESEDHGKFIRSKLSKFEENYNIENYSLTNYLDKIKAPIQIHQGMADDAVPYEWSRTLVKRLKKEKIETKYFEYPNADHNLQPSWELAIKRTLNFYKSNLE